MSVVPTRWTPDGIAYWSLGHGPAVVCVHGGPGTDHSFFRTYLDPLSHGVRVVYFDLPGHGLSDAPEDFGLDAMSESIERVRIAAGLEKMSLLGSSYGGFLSLLYASRRREFVDSLVLVDTAASHGFREESITTAQRRGTPAMLAALARLWDGSLQTDTDFHAAWREILPLYFHQLPLEEVLQLADRSTYSLETRKQILPTLADYDIRPLLGRIEIPSIVIVGEYDWITSVHQAQELAAGLQRGDLIVFERSGHYPFIEENDRFLRSVRHWLNSNLP